MLKNIKVEKLNSIILRELTSIISKEYWNSPIMSNVIIHEVITSNDFSQTKIYYSIIDLNRYEPDEVHQTISKYRKNIRHKLSQKITIYKTPELFFVYDKTLENANKIQEILNDINANKSK